MTERERLTELIMNTPKIPVEINGRAQGRTYQTARNIADHLLANGVIVPPCKVGDTVYSITECSCENIDGVYTECEFYGHGTDDRICTIPNGAKCPYQYRVIECYVTEFNILMFAREWGKTVFLTREDAEKALEERSKS